MFKNKGAYKKLKLMFCLAYAGLLIGSARAVDVSTADELQDVIEGDASASITLVADIDMSEWTPLAFSGTLDGNGKTLTGLTSGVFTELTGGAVVENLTIVGTNCDDVWPASSASYGMIANTANGATIRNCTIKDCVFSTNAGGSSNRTMKIGGVVGSILGAGATIEDCAVINCTVGRKDGNISNSTFAGGVVAYSQATVVSIRNCFVSACTVRMHTAGGVAGAILSERTAESQQTIEGCFMSGMVEGGTAAGGVIGAAGDGSDTKGRYTIRQCRNEATVFVSSTGCSGGMIGNVYRGSTYDVIACVNYGDISVGAANGNKGAGGLIGGLQSGTSGSAMNLRL